MRNLSFALPLLLVAGSFVSVPSAQSGVSGGPVDPWPHGDPPRYRVRDVSPSRPVAEVGMNIFGHVGSSDEEEAPFVWVNGRIRWLPMYPGSDDCAVLDVNDLGEAVGGCEDFPSYVALLWRDDTYITLNQYWWKSGAARAINNRSQITGTYKVNSSILQRRGFFYDAGVFPPLATVIEPFTGYRSRGYDINEHGQVAGTSYYGPQTDDRGFLWQRGQAMELLGVLRYSETWAHAINDAGDIVGRSKLGSAHDWLPVLWSEGEVVGLPTYPGDDETNPWDINNRGEIVGGMRDQDGPAVRLTRDEIHDLNTLVVNLEDWYFHEAKAINDVGQIAGWGYRNDGAHVFRLDPLPSVFVYGSGANPEGSLVVEGRPFIGGTVRVGLDDPQGNVMPGSLTFLQFSKAPDPAFPAGTVLPGMGTNGSGELLVSLAPGDAMGAGITGDYWLGPGIPTFFELAIPLDPTLVGAVVYAQGALFDLTAPAGERIALTDAVELAIWQ